MDEVIVRLQDLPIKINGMTILDSDENYNVYINARLSCDDQRKAYEHELEHIRRDDFYNSCSIQEVEAL